MMTKIKGFQKEKKSQDFRRKWRYLKRIIWNLKCQEKVISLIFRMNMTFYKVRLMLIDLIKY